MTVMFNSAFVARLSVVGLLTTAISFSHSHLSGINGRVYGSPADIVVQAGHVRSRPSLAFSASGATAVLYSDAIESMEFTQDGKFLATLCAGSLILWSADSYQEIRE